MTPTIAVLPLVDNGRVDRPGADRLELLTALLGGPSVDPLFGQELIRIPLEHAIYRWDCLVADCERARAGRGDLCSAHQREWRGLGQAGTTAKAQFVARARPLPLAEWPEEHPCRLCPHRPARNISLRLCGRHQFRWYRHRHTLGWPSRHGVELDGDFDAWLRGEQSYGGYGVCLVAACPELANSPLGLCARHESRYVSQGRPGGARLPVQWARRYVSAARER